MFNAVKGVDERVNVFFHFPLEVSVHADNAILCLGLEMCMWKFCLKLNTTEVRQPFKSIKYKIDNRWWCMLCSKSVFWNPNKPSSIKITWCLMFPDSQTVWGHWTCDLLKDLSCLLKFYFCSFHHPPALSRVDNCHSITSYTWKATRVVVDLGHWRRGLRPETGH